ncbi:uncharacterized protein LOC143305829 [Osmia lignaria lignaria]|uniref:uncharacterized protein LOC143305829 n=1 Tax=Osmia lignaria lignaria TaxID=1437193 RepID=UPI00402BDF26
MCDHCKTFKPLLGGTDRLYQKGSPIIQKPTPMIQEQTTNPADKGCCSWRRSCCSGGCCDRIGNCCTGSDSPSQNEKLPTSYGYGGYGYGQPSMGMTMEIPFQMTDGSVEKVPCGRQEKKLPMCFGGDCKDSEEKCENDVSQAPRQSER